MKKALVATRFTGGLTDNYVGGRVDQYQKADNMILTPDGKLQTRPGFNNAVGGSTRSRALLASNTSRRTGVMASYAGFIFQQVETTLQYDNGSAMTNLQGPGSTDAFNQITSDEEAACTSQWNNHMFWANDVLQRPIKVYNDSTPKLRTAGLPKPSSTPASPLVALTADATTNPYIVALVYKYTYTVDGVTFVDRGSPRYFRRPNNSTVASGDLDSYVYANGTGQHYDVSSSNFKIEYYRTTNSGNVLYYVGECANATTTTSITDGIADATLQDNATLYVTGGIADNDRPPSCKYLHMTTNFGYYAHGKEVDVDSADGTLYTNRLWQSKPGDVDSVPADFFVDVNEEITGVSSIRSTPIVFTEDSIYRIDGTFDSFGRGGMIAQKISDTVGTVGHNSIVQTLDGLYFASTDGFYYTDGYRIVPLSDEFLLTYQSLVNTNLKKLRVAGVYDDENRWVIWGVRGTEEGTDNNQAYVFDLRSFRRDELAFTTWSSGFREEDDENRYSYLENNFQPCSFVMHNEELHMADSRGYVFKFDKTRLKDIEVDTATADVDNWTEIAILYDYRSSAMDFGAPEVRKWASEIVVRAKGEVNSSFTNLTLQIKTDNDKEQEYSELAPIRDFQAVVWGDPNYNWGDVALWTSKDKLFENKRRVPAGNLRCSYKQVIFCNAFAILKNSDSFGLGTIAGSGSTRTFTLGPYDLLGDSVHYKLLFDDDSYVDEHEISAQVTTANTGDSIAGSATNNGFLYRDDLDYDTISNSDLRVGATASMWLKGDKTGTSRIFNLGDFNGAAQKWGVDIATTANPTSVQIEVNGTLGASANLSGEFFPTDIANADWHHYCFVYDAGTVYVYVDGDLEVTQTGFDTSFVASTSDNFKTLNWLGYLDGAGPTYATTAFMLDDDSLASTFAFFDTALNASEVAWLFNAGANDTMIASLFPKVSNLLSLWYDNTGNDASTNNNDATVRINAGTGPASASDATVPSVDGISYTVETPDDDIAIGNNKGWVLKGFNKGDILSIQDYVVYYELLTDSQAPFDGSTGENA